MTALRRLYRLTLAAWLPTAYARHVNSERVSFLLRNDPDGQWTAQVGRAMACRHRNMRRAVLAAHREANAMPGWQWPSDYLRGIGPTGNWLCRWLYRVTDHPRVAECPVCHRVRVTMDGSCGECHGREGR